MIFYYSVLGTYVGFVHAVVRILGHIGHYPTAYGTRSYSNTQFVLALTAALGVGTPLESSACIKFINRSRNSQTNSIPDHTDAVLGLDCITYSLRRFYLCSDRVRIYKQIPYSDWPVLRVLSGISPIRSERFYI